MEYLPKTIIKKNKNEFNKIYNKLKDKLGEEWTITYSLVGSSKRNLVLLGNPTKGYDLDYHIYLIKYPSSLTAKEIKLNYFKKILDDIVKDCGLEDCEDSTNVLTIKKIEDEKVTYSYDVAIMKYNKNKDKIILKNEKEGKDSDYHYVLISDSSSFYETYRKIKENSLWGELRIEYKKNKEKHMNDEKDNRPASFTLLKDAVNTTLQNNNIK